MLGFLTDEDTLTIPDKIEEVNAESLLRIVSEEEYVTVLFFDESKGIKLYKNPKILILVVDLLGYSRFMNHSFFPPKTVQTF